jgi:hypothetical protein
MNPNLPTLTLLYSSNLDAKFGTPTDSSFPIYRTWRNGSSLHPTWASMCPVRPRKLMWQAVVGFHAPRMSSTKPCVRPIHAPRVDTAPKRIWQNDKGDLSMLYALITHDCTPRRKGRTQYHQFLLLFLLLHPIL